MPDTSEMPGDENGRVSAARGGRAVLSALGWSHCPGRMQLGRLSLCAVGGSKDWEREREQKTLVRCSILQGEKREGWLKILARKRHPIVL